MLPTALVLAYPNWRWLYSRGLFIIKNRFMLAKELYYVLPWSERAQGEKVPCFRSKSPQPIWLLHMLVSLSA